MLKHKKNALTKQDIYLTALGSVIYFVITTIVLYITQFTPVYISSTFSSYGPSSFEASLGYVLSGLIIGTIVKKSPVKIAVFSAAILGGIHLLIMDYLYSTTPPITISYQFWLFGIIILGVCFGGFGAYIGQYLRNKRK